MQVMRCPECRAHNAVRREMCWSCGADLWPQVRPERLCHARRVPARREAAPNGLGQTALRILRRLLGMAR